MEMLKKNWFTLVFLFIAIALCKNLASASDLNEKLSIEGTLTGVYQHGDFEGIKDGGRGAGVLDFGINLRPTDKDEFQITLSHAAGNAWNKVDPFSLSLYADDLEAGLENISGRERDYLLEAWYKRTFTFSEDISLGITGGIIGAYIDDNAFANDEIRQFMNDIFVNSTLANLPCSDLGGIAELDTPNFSVRGLMMNSKTEEGGKNYNYYALQLGHKVDTPMGEGNYRVYGFTTNKRFQTRDGTRKENLQGFGISADQKLSKILGAFARLGWQDDKAAIVDHDQLYSGGLNISGDLWGRKNDAMGLGYAYLNGADKAEIDSTNAIEAYARFKLSDFSDITFDVQYVNDNMKQGKDRKGFIYGVRKNAYF